MKYFVAVAHHWITVLISISDNAQTQARVCAHPLHPSAHIAVHLFVLACTHSLIGQPRQPCHEFIFRDGYF
jgi:hypothetical protein